MRALLLIALTACGVEEVAKETSGQYEHRTFATCDCNALGSKWGSKVCSPTRGFVPAPDGGFFIYEDCYNAHCCEWR